ncbi:MAG: oligosaccharide flippase family protein [Anaerolineae bacterium]
MGTAIPVETIRPLKHLGLNSLWVLLARLGAQALSVIFTALIARRLGASGFGEYALITSIVFLGNVLTTFGTDSLLIRQIARTHATESNLLSTIFWTQIALSALFIALVVPFGSNTPALPLYTLALLPLAFYSIYSAILRGFERMDLYLLLNLAAAALQLVCGVIIFILGADLVALMLALLVSQALAAALAWALVRRSTGASRIVWRMPHTYKSTLRAALPFALLTACALIYQRMGIFAMGTISGNDTTGWFSAAARIVEALKIVPQALLGALFPMLARSAVGNHSTRLTRMSMELSVGFCLIAAALLALLAGPLVYFIYGDSFSTAIRALQILAWSLVPYALTANITLEMISQGHEWPVFRLTLIAVLIALLAFALLIPALGLIGACWASLIAESAQAVLFVAANRKGVRAG